MRYQQQDDRTKQSLKEWALQHLEEGHTLVDTAQAIGADTTTISRWRRQLREEQTRRHVRHARSRDRS